MKTVSWPVKNFHQLKRVINKHSRKGSTQLTIHIADLEKEKKTITTQLENLNK